MVSLGPIGPYNPNGQVAHSRDGPNPIKAGRKPTSDDFKTGAITRAVLAETLAEPVTVYPVAGSVVALAWTVMIAASPVSLGLAVGGAFVGGAAWIYNYVVKGEERTAAYISRLREARRHHEQLEVEDLALQCEQLGFAEGVKEARELNFAYKTLLDYIAANASTKQSMSIERFRILAEDTFRQGAQVLRQSLALFKAMESIDTKALESEIRTWQNQLNSELGTASGGIFERQIEAHKKRIDLCNQRKQKLIQLLAQANEIESALQSTYLELVDLGNQDPNVFLAADGGACKRLETAVEAARRVEQKLRGDDAKDRAERDMYIRASEEQKP